MAVLRWFKSKDNKFFAYYLMHDYAFSAWWRGANPEALETRMTTFADTITAALTQDVDEVLIVGHSSGAHLAVSILAYIMRSGRAQAGVLVAGSSRADDVISTRRGTFTRRSGLSEPR